MIFVEYVKRFATVVIFVLTFLLAGAASAEDQLDASELPPDDIRDKIIAALNEQDARDEGIAFFPNEDALTTAITMSQIMTSKRVPPTCRMNKLQIPVGTGADANSKDMKRYKALVDLDATLVLVNKMAVNIDGSAKAYHPLDAYGKCTSTGNGGGEVCAINALCNGGIRLFDEQGKEIKCSRKTATYKTIWDTAWSKISSGAIKLLPDSYWPPRNDGKPTQRYGYYDPQQKVVVAFRSNIVPRNAKGHPCRRDKPATKFIDYFVNSTALKGDEGPDEPEGKDWSAIVSDEKCNPVREVDPENLPAIVIPVNGFRGAKPGDAVVAIMERNGRMSQTVLAVVGDKGPDLGEATPAFNAALLGKALPPLKNYNEAVSYHIENPKNPDRVKIGLLILKNTSAKLKDPKGDDLLLSKENVSKVVKAAFAEWGGGTAEQAEQRLRSCFDYIKEQKNYEGLATE